MGEFFKGWRRKAGSITLVLAFALIVEWTRSCLTADYFTYEMERSGTVIKSLGGRFSVSAVRLGEFEKYPIVRWTSVPPADEILDQLERRNFEIYEIPYAVLVIPVAALSYLLLVRPRVAKPKSGPTQG
jgi:hypothetical protein